MLKTKANSAAKKTLKTAKRAVDEAGTNAAMGAAAVKGRRGSLEGMIQPDFLLAKARAAGVPIGGGRGGEGGEPEPEPAAPIVTVRREHLGEHAERFPRLDGYLEKQQKGGAGMWQRRWFVLDGCVVYYYRSSKDVEKGVPPLGRIWSHDILTVRAIDGGDRQPSFLLEAYREEKPDKPRAFPLRAATDALVSRWVESLDRSRRLITEVGIGTEALLAAAEESAAAAAEAEPAAPAPFGRSEHQGYLFKQNPRGMWQKRWCILSDGQLLYKASKKSEQSNTIALQTCRSIQKDSANRAAINIDNGERVFKLMADSDAEADEWVDLLQRAWKMVGGGSDGSELQDCELVRQWDESVDAAQAGIEATFARIFASAVSAADVQSTLDAADQVLLEIIGVHTQLAAAGHFGRSDIAEYHTAAYHSLIHARLSETVSARPDAATWTQLDALYFIIWCGEYHERLREVTSLDLAEKFTELSIVPPLTERYTPGLQIHAQKRSPKGGGKLQVWQKRWFVLQHCRLSYYRSQNDDEPLGSILLSQVSSLVQKEDTNDLKMIVAGRKTVIRFETAEDATLWMQTLERCRQLAAQVEPLRHGNAKVISKVAVQYDDAAPGQLSSEIDVEFMELDANNGDVADIMTTLAAAESITYVLTVLLDDVATCQPPREDIAQFYVEQYHRRLYAVICGFLTTSALEAMEAKHILLLVGWVYNYHERLQKLGGDVPPELRMTSIPAFQQVLEHIPTVAGVLRKLSPRAKRGRGVKGWQKRYFVLKNCILYYYKNEPMTPDETPQGEIRMDQLKSLTLADSNGSLGMKLAVAGRVYYLMAESEEDLRTWVDAVERSTLRGIVQAVDSDGLELDQQSAAGGAAAVAQPPAKKKKRFTPDGVAGEFQNIFEPKNGYAEEVDEDLGHATSIVLKLASVLDGFVFDQVDQSVVDELASQCHASVVSRIDAYVRAIPADAYEQGITHMILSWMTTYHGELEEQTGALVPVLFELDCITPLCEHYQASMLDTMTKWVKNLIKLERESVDQIEHSEEEGLFTRGPIDLFTMVNQQVKAAHSTGVDQLTFNVLTACEIVFAIYVKEITKQVKKDWATLPLEFLCATINNCSRTMEYCTELAEQSEMLLSDTQLARLSPDAAVQGFLGVAKTLIAAIVDQMMVDISPLFEKIFSDKWFGEFAGMAAVVATVGDFFCDLQFWLQEQFFKRLVTQLLDRLVYSYIEALLVKKVKISKMVMEGIATDLEQIAELADPEAGFVRESSLRKRTQVIDDVRELMVVEEPNLAKKFSNRYADILEIHPDASIVMGHVVKMRSDLKKQQRAGVLDACKKIKIADGASASAGLFARMQAANPEVFG